MEKRTLDHIHQMLLEWYGIYGRKSLPWRNLKGTHAPYGVYVSEIMLQQTQVSVVLDKYYFPFLDTFPTLEVLSKADENAVLRLWRGLGYYLRAKNMLKTAKICRQSLPSDPKELIKLPGIGAYTAGAIACFGFGRAVSFVDGNIKRVLSRFFALKAPSMGELQRYAQAFLNHTDSFSHNQALLDIGASVCLPLLPKCPLCPLQSHCKGKDTPTLYTQKSKITYKQLVYDLGVYIQEGKVALALDNILSYQGLYNFPKICSDRLLEFPLIGSFKHFYTNHRLEVRVYLLSDKKYLEDSKGVVLFTPQELADLPISAMTLKVLDLLASKEILRVHLD
ncbi:hypothetical protein BKH46_03950 [Helicobacter sp. 12S02634-8]|uniref:A/G-specific adenine glycosylase n=1 Tax=Helicobacter sp. 12S02634-8 TaxID=1476199 RepID=UPI000BA61EF3|nr:A/G-specific adenine glycosylase [Helicobacter sp. 12S02634-8]PAF47586.1 hypothetical protein BKH46_03950 [Helicobacter sp. 12S02634-8]